MDWLLRHARLHDDAPLVDIGIRDGRIVALKPAGANEALPAATSSAAPETWDLAGRVVLPGLIDVHTHLDKTYIDTQNQSGTLLEAIEVWRQAKHERTPAQIRTTVRRALRTAIANGVTAMRSHVDTEEEVDLPTLALLCEVREEFQPDIDLQLVALGWPGTTRECDAVMHSALAMGVDAIGAAPALTPDPERCIDAVFQLAQSYDRPIDLHVDESEDPRMCTLGYMAAQTMAYGMQGHVTAGHCCSLDFVDDVVAGRIMDCVAQAGIHIVTLPSCNLVLLGRDRHPVPRGVTRVKEFLKRGVNVCAASDNVHDPFNPFGSYDLLQIANLSAHASHLTGLAELRASLAMITDHPARLMQGKTGRSTSRETGSVTLGAPADLVILDTNCVLNAILAPPARLGTFKAGRLLVRTEISRVWSASTAQGN